ncbi:MAG: DMT family transporter [Proteobacteria bacterium]|nr:DMT family transporter [Pseudomonadota bacterium]
MAVPQESSTSPVSRAAGSPLLVLGLLLVLGTMWGGTVALAKFVMTAGVSPIGYLFWQSLGPVIVLCPVMLKRGAVPRPTFRNIRFYMILGAIALVLANTNLYLVLARIPAGVAAVIITTSTLMTYALAVAFRMERLERRRAVGIFCGFAGALLILLPRTSLPSPDMAGWIALAFLTPLAYAIGNIFAARYRPSGGSSLGHAYFLLVAVSVMLAPLVLGTGHFYPLLPPFDLVDLAVIAQIAVASIAYFMFFEILRRAGPVYFSQVGYVITVTGILWGMVFFGESHSGWVWGAVALIFAGLALIGRRPAAA